MSSGAQKSPSAHAGRRVSTDPTCRKWTRSFDRSSGNAGSQSPDVEVAYQPPPTRRSDGSGWSPGMSGFAAAAGRNAPASAAARTATALRSRCEALAATTDQALLRELDDAGGRRRLSDDRGARVMALQQPDGDVRVLVGDHHAEAAAHVEHLVQLVVLHAAALGDMQEDRRHLERRVDPVARVRLEPQQVEEAVAGDVREPAHVDVRVE